jgi:hypothetical protein
LVTEFCGMIKRYVTDMVALGMTIKRKFLKTIQDVPGGPVLLHSPFYISRPSIETAAFAEIAKPGCLLRLKAPQKMGKSTLMLRLIDQARRLSYQSLHLDLQLADHLVLSSQDRFLRWFCAHASRELGLEPQLDHYWDNEISSQINCLIYLQDYLLQQIDSPVLICINEVNRIFDYPAVTQVFLPLVRALHQESRYSKVLQKLRLVLAYSTEIYVPLKLHQSPFNVGKLIELPEFTLSEIQLLAKRYELDWTVPPGLQQALALCDLVGGHPYLVQLALYQLATRTNGSESEIAIAFDQLLEQAPTLAGIYTDHLQRHLSVLYTHPDLTAALNQVLVDEAAILPSVVAHKLQSLGLIQLKGEQAVISCKLYRLFFSAYALYGWAMDVSKDAGKNTSKDVSKI